MGVILFRDGYRLIEKGILRFEGKGFLNIVLKELGEGEEVRGWVFVWMNERGKGE